MLIDQKNEWVTDSDFRNWTAQLGFVENAFVIEEEKKIYLHIGLDAINENGGKFPAVSPTVTLELVSYEQLSDDDVIDVMGYFNDRDEDNLVPVYMVLSGLKIGPFDFSIIADEVTAMRIIEPCPICGSNAELIELENDYLVKCSNCGLSISGNESIGALVKWNKKRYDKAAR